MNAALGTAAQSATRQKNTFVAARIPRLYLRRDDNRLILESVQTLVELNWGKEHDCAGSRPVGKPIDSYGTDVGQDPQDIHPFNCHSSAPAHQPIKHLWNGAKNLISIIQHDGLESTVAAFKDPIRAKVLDYRI